MISINSRGIREHLMKRNYQFSSMEAAWLVWHSHKVWTKSRSASGRPVRIIVKSFRHYRQFIF
jgi:hypothetical protein